MGIFDKISSKVLKKTQPPEVTNNMTYFSPQETSCKCGCSFDITPAFLAKLNTLRAIINKPMSITSGARCAAHNAKVGGASKSQHVNGIAVDIKADPYFAFVLVKEAIGLGFTGIGIAVSFVHLDTRAGVPVIWQYGK